MSNARDIDIEEARRLFEYNPDTGELTSKTHRRNMPKGTVVVSTTPYGYLRARVSGRLLLGHRLAWAIHYGEQPPAVIDHKNRDKKDNRIDNLRACSQAQNVQNSTGRGYSVMSNGKYQAAVKLNGKRIAIGTYDTPEEANAAYLNKKKELHSSFVE